MSKLVIGRNLVGEKFLI